MDGILWALGLVVAFFGIGRLMVAYDEGALDRYPIIKGTLWIIGVLILTLFVILQFTGIGPDDP